MSGETSPRRSLARRTLLLYAHPGAGTGWLLLLAGLVLETLSLPPGPAPVLVLAADVPFLWLAGGAANGRWRRWTLLYALLHFGLALRWLGEVHPAEVLGAAVVLAPVLFLAAALLRVAVRRGAPYLVAVPSVLVLEELLRTVWFGGMPWPSRSLAFAELPARLGDPLLASTAYVGGYGLVFLAAASGAALAALRPAWALPRRVVPPAAPSRAAWAGLLLPALVLAALLGLGALRRADVAGRLASGEILDSGGARLVAAQGAIPQDLKHADASDAPMRIYQTHLGLTRDALDAEARAGHRVLAVLWPETMIPWIFLTSELAHRFPDEWENVLRILSHLRALADDPADVPRLLLGAIWQYRRDDERHARVTSYGTHDSLLVIDAAKIPPTGAEPPPPPPPGAPYPWILARHDKVVLVPGGEYTPLGELFPPLRWFRNLVAVIPELDPGAPDQAPFVLAEIPSPAGPRAVHAGTVICFELLFPATCRGWRLRGAEVLLNAANYGWFGPTGFRAQIRAAAALRAAETGLTVVMAGNTGPTAFWDPLGRRYGLFTDERGRTLPAGGDETTFEPGWAAGRVRADPRPTLYARLGDLPWVLLGLGLPLLGIVSWHVRDRSRTMTSRPAGGGSHPGGEAARPEGENL